MIWVDVGAVIGSSPLARGLRLQRRVQARSRRIIPARAGFTRRPAVDRYPGRDHPRSRGVYPPTPTLWGRRRGSSPLARGLPPITHGALPTTRIIPARAGFTLGVRLTGVKRRDHPRSRGVYEYGPCGDSPTVGSSPLARGLQGDVVPVQRTDGIIPARAGFTGVPRFFLPPLSDHPRSRGVYSARTLSAWGVRGSSPLARGLRWAWGSRRWRPGIIPARAGFTWGHQGRTEGGPDHPRSRGVY